jgi:hypothetical protein
MILGISNIRRANSSNIGGRTFLLTAPDKKNWWGCPALMLADAKYRYVAIQTHEISETYTECRQYTIQYNQG